MPSEDFEYFHPRYTPDGDENDFADFHLVRKLIWNCDAIDVSNLPDSGLWKEEKPTKAVHLSSIGAVAAGLTRAARIGIEDIPERLIANTARQIQLMAGRESAHHDTDLALLTLVRPLGEDVPIPRTRQREIVERVERELLGTRGVIRYPGSEYNVCHAGSPEWTMGLGFLALAWNALGERERAIGHLLRLQSSATSAGELAESWCRDPEHDRCVNSPLCWSHALHVVALTQLGEQSLVRAA